MSKIFEEPQIVCIRFDESDVITASETLGGNTDPGLDDIDWNSAT